MIEKRKTSYQPVPFARSARLPGFKPHTLVMLLLVPLAVVVALFVTSEREYMESRLLGVGIISFLVGMAWLDNHVETKIKKKLWYDVARRTGLRCTVRGLFFGRSVHVEGTYRGHLINLSTPRQGKGQVPATRITLTVANPARATLRLRGPFDHSVAATDTITSRMFATTTARPFGDERRFFMRSQPLHLSTALSSNRLLWEQLQQLERLTNIELDGDTLSFEQLGVLTDAEQLQQLFDLLSDIVDMFEQRRLLGTHTLLAPAA